MDTKKLVEEIMAQFKRPHARFPYLIARLRPAVYAVAPLPIEFSRDRLLEIAQFEMRAYRGNFQMYVVFGEEDALCILPDGTASEGPRPRGGQVVPWILERSKSGLIS